MTDSLQKKISEKKAVIAVLGLGYVGLSLLEAFGKAGFSLLGYDRNKHKIDALHEGKSYLSGIPLKNLLSLVKKKTFLPSSDPSILEKADVFIITVPTSLDNHRLPDLSKVRNAAHVILKYLKKGSLVIVQSTSFPGTTEQEILPILQQSHLKVGQDFFLSFIPEISDFGNEAFDFAAIPKVIGGVTEKCYEMAKLLYQHITKNIFHCSSPKIAEAAKILQNTYRLLNITLINEMKIMFDRMGIDIWEVIEAASKKPFGFTPFYPGPGIGGDCIPVDPFYLSWKARETDGPTSLIDLAGDINDSIPHFVFNKIGEALGYDHKNIPGSKVLILGVGFKKDVNDIREAPSLKLLSLLQQKGADFSYHDPYVKEIVSLPRYPHLVARTIDLDYAKFNQYDCVVIITDHSVYDWPSIIKHSKRIVDTRNVTKGISGAKEKVIKA